MEKGNKYNTAGKFRHAMPIIQKLIQNFYFVRIRDLALLPNFLVNELPNLIVTLSCGSVFFFLNPKVSIIKHSVFGCNLTVIPTRSLIVPYLVETRKPSTKTHPFHYNTIWSK